MRKTLLLVLGVLLTCMQLLAQNRTVTGKITDETGKPVANSSVIVKGTRNGTTTASDGSFSVTVPEKSNTIVVSSVGYASQEINVGNRTDVAVQLKGAQNSLQEVVVTAYGTQRRVNLTSSQTRVGGANFEDVPLSSADQMLQGKAAGVQSSAFSGQPGANQQVRIRGVGSVTASSQPLYVVDGVQINAGDLSRSNTTSNALAGLNPNDIDNVTVLKDASATALYGARGSNGVIIITTKKGRSGKTQFRLDTEVGSTTYATFPDAGKPLDAADWLALAREGYINAGYTADQADAKLKNYGAGTTNNTDWLNLLTRTGTQQQYNLSASGGDAKTTFYISGSYFQQQAPVVGSDMKRYTGNINIRHQASNRLSFQFGMQSSYDKINVPLGNNAYFSNPVLGIWFLRPVQHPYNADGTLNISRASNTDFPNIPNPLYIIQNNIYQTRQIQARPNLTTEFTILKGLKYTNKSALDFNDIEEMDYYNPNHGDGLTLNGYGANYYTRYALLDEINQLDYHVDALNNNFHIDAKALHEAISSNEYVIDAEANNYPNDKSPYSINAATVTNGKGGAYEYTFQSYVGQLVLNYQNKYVLSGSFRRDGSSRFGANKKYGNFPSIGFSWNASQEKFLSNIPHVSLLKLRASYGSTGNAEIGNYQSVATQASGYNYNGQPGIAFGNVGNADLTWEKTNQFDAGIDIGLFNNRVNITADYYDRRTSNMLFNIPLPLELGGPSPSGLGVGGTQIYNYGAMYNKGIELAIDATPVQTKNFNWNLNFNFTHNKNRITSLFGGNDVANGNFNLREGYDVQSFYTRLWAGVDPANGNPLWYTDATKSQTTSSYPAASARVMYGSASPKYYGGFTNTLSFKGFSLSAELYYNYGNLIRDTWATYLTDGQYALSYGKYAVNLQRWQNPGDVTNVPKYVYGTGNSSNSFSTRFLYKGDYIRLRNLTVGYQVPSSVMNHLHFSSLRFYVRGTNLWTKTYDKNLTIDPEQGASSASNLNIMLPRVMTVGINIGF